MSPSLDFHPSVRGEVASARGWYEQQQPGLGTDFLDAVERALDDIAADPAGHGFADADIRAAPLTRFPYAVYYRVLPNRIRVLAVYHTSRDPAGWQSRS